MSDDDVLAAAWRQQSLWSKTADVLKASLTRWRTVILAGLVAGAVLETMALQFESGSVPQRGLALAGAAALAVVPVVRSSKVDRDSIVDWTRARSASEAIKQEVYEYLTRTGDYRQADGRERRLTDSVGDVLRNVDDLAIHSVAVEPSDREPPEPMTVAEYLDSRVGGQIDGYYTKKARELARKAGRIRTIELVLAVAAALLGAAAAVFGSGALSGWVAVATTVAGALVAHREAARYEHLVVSYSTTARRLDALRTSWRLRIAEGPPTPQEEDELVAQCEAAISVENQSWMTSWSRSPLG